MCRLYRTDSQNSSRSFFHTSGQDACNLEVGSLLVCRASKKCKHYLSHGEWHWFLWKVRQGLITSRLGNTSMNKGAYQRQSCALSKMNLGGFFLGGGEKNWKKFYCPKQRFLRFEQIWGFILFYFCKIIGAQNCLKQWEIIILVAGEEGGGFCIATWLG